MSWFEWQGVAELPALVRDFEAIAGNARRCCQLLRQPQKRIQLGATEALLMGWPRVCRTRRLRLQAAGVVEVPRLPEQPTALICSSIHDTKSRNRWSIHLGSGAPATVAYDPWVLRWTVAMPPMVPDPKKTKSFRNEAAFEKWLAANHAREQELWLKIHKKDSGLSTVTYAQALDVALCWGWIDGIRKAYDDTSFLQRFTPRKPKSIWSQTNQGHVARLTAEGRMTPHGQRHVDAAKADGRWDAAYAPIRSATANNVPADLRAAIDANPRAQKKFKTLGRMNLFALAFRVNHMKTPAGRAKKIAGLVAMLARGETIVPESQR